MIDQERRFGQLCYQVFLKNDDGKELLEIAKNKYIYELPVCPPGSQEGFGYWREGQNSVIKLFDIMAKTFIENQSNQPGEYKK